MSNTAEALIQDIRQCGIILKVEGEDIRFKPQSRMTLELLDRLRDHKQEVISELANPVYVTTTPKNTGKKGRFRRQGLPKSTI